MSLLLLGVAVLASANACTDQPRSSDGEVAPAAATAAPVTQRELSPEDRKFYRDVATSAWKFLDANYNPSTGLVKATADWANTTIWDIGGQLLAFRAAKELGLLPAAEFDKRVGRTLKTLQSAPLYNNVAFNKVISTTTGKVGEGGMHGYAATDIGRLLVALKVISVQEPKFRSQIEAIVKRLDFSTIVKDGYLYGQLTGSSGKPWTFQEGRIGYEQYVARGFAEWGADVANAMDVKKNGRPKKVMGVTLLEDTRWQDRLLSEPFVLYGLELGLDGDYRELAENVLKAQQARYDSTGKITIVSEDASSIAPHYFYYYCVYCSGKPFSIDVSTPGKTLDGPRWVSTKAAFGWHALFPSDYTKKAVDYVAAARDASKGWASGVMEGSGKSTNSWDVNTSAVLLEVAYYQLRGGKPLIETATVTPD